MNTKTKTFSMFLLGAILVAGTISMAIPKSFAFSFGDSYAKDYKKHGSNVNIQKAKCNNIIINGVEKSHQMPGDMTENTMTAAADENDVTGQLIRDGSANGENKFKSISGNIVNVCINKNNIAAVAEEEPGTTCDDCFQPRNEDMGTGVIPPDLLTLLNTWLDENAVVLGGVVLPVGDVEGLCNAIEGLSTTTTPATEDEITIILTNAWRGQGNTQPFIERVIECLLSIPGLIEPETE